MKKQTIVLLLWGGLSLAHSLQAAYTHSGDFTISDKLGVGTDTPTAAGVTIDVGSATIGLGAGNYSNAWLLFESGVDLLGIDPNQLASDSAVFYIQNTRSDGAIRFYTGSPSTSRMHIDSDGDIGIGTATPAGELHVQSKNGNVMTVENHANGDTFSSGNMLRIRNSSLNTNNRYIRFTANWDADDGLPAIDFGSIEFGVDDAFVFRNPSGNSIAFLGSKVGIGTTNPTEELEVVGDVKITGQAIIGNVPPGGNISMGTFN